MGLFITCVVHVTLFSWTSKSEKADFKCVDMIVFANSSLSHSCCLYSFLSTLIVIVMYESTIYASIPHSHLFLASLK
jgi:hypothetical protein